MNDLSGADACPVGANELLCALRTIEEDTDVDAMIRRSLNLEAAEPVSSAARIICSPLMMLYAVVGRLLVPGSDWYAPSSVAEVDTLFTSQNADITSYDKWRFDALRKMVKTLLPKTR